MEKQIKQLVDFQTAFNSPVLDKPTIPSRKRSTLRRKLLKEEVKELNDAVKVKDIVEVADALTDILYIVFGTACEFGLQDKLAACFEAVHVNNMSKLGPDGKPIYNDYGKIIKPAGFKPVDLRSIVLGE